MDIKDLIAFGLTFTSMAFGFGRQSGELKTLRRDTDNIGKGHREIIDRLQEIDKKLERLDQRVIYCEKE
ncbi:MAG: hypothetical protein ACKPCM_13750 [Pseudanabaena sp.]